MKKSKADKRAEKVHDEIVNINIDAGANFLSGDRSPKALKMMRTQYAAIAERAETAASEGLQPPEGPIIKGVVELKRDNFRERAAKSYALAGYASSKLGDYNGAAQFYESSARNYHGLANESGVQNYKEMLIKEKKEKGLAKMMRIRASISGLLKKLPFAAVILIFCFGILFLSSNITGNVIGNMTNSTSNIIGAAFLVVGLVGGFF